MYEYLLAHPCVDCGETDPIVLDADHVRGKKHFNISAMLQGYAWSAVLEELEKCEMRCANCHRRKTAKEFGYDRHKRFWGERRSPVGF